MTNLTMISVDYRKIGPTTLDVWRREFERVNSPLLPYTEEMWSAAGNHSALCLGMMWLENQYATTGIIIKPQDFNPLSMRPWLEDPRADTMQPVIDWKTRKEVGTIRVPDYCAGAIVAGDGSMMLRFNTPTDAIREWRRRIIDDPLYKANAFPGGAYTNLFTLEDMLNRYAPPGDVHPETDVDNADIAYPQVVATKLNHFFEMEQEQETDVAAWSVVLSAGHRNTNKGGARGEYEWTPWATRMLRDEVVKRGGKAYIIQEERGTGDFYNGGLQAAARACVDLARTKGPFVAYISMHYDSSRGFHSIFPDGANDTKAMNPLDVRLSRRIRDAVQKTKTVGMKSWTADSPGVMSERETHVGSQGYRLGEFVGTLGFRSTTARVILEASGVGDEKFIHDPNWVKNTYCPAIVDALEAEFGKLSGGKPTPEPQPDPDAPKYADPDPIKEVEGLPAYVKLANGAKLVYVGYTGRTKRKTPRLRHAYKGAPSIQEDIPEGTEFWIDYLIENPDETLFYYTPWHTRVIFEDVEPLFADVDKRNYP